MQKNICSIFLSLMFCSVFFAVQANSRPTALMVEFLRNPSLGNVNTPFPNFSWIVNGLDSQNTYQILVATSRKKLDAGVGDLWDSGKISSKESVNITYRGVPLNPITSYFWSVRIGTRKSKSLLISDIQEFKTGTFAGGSSVSVMPLSKHPIRPRVIIRKNLIGNYFADFGKDAFGTLRVQIKSQNSDSVVVYLGEKLESPDCIKRNPGGTIRSRFIGLHIDKGMKWYTVSIPHIPRNSKYPAIVMPDYVGEVTPFRYCEIETHSPLTTCEGVEQLAVNYYWDDTASSFTCPDTILNNVWNLCKYSIKATSFCGVYVDGDRERIPYEADAYINQLGHYCTDREYSMARYSNEYLMLNPTWPTEWIMHSVMLAYTDYLYTGDDRSLRKFYNDLKNKSLTALEREDGLISTKTGLLNESVLHDIHIQQPLKDIVDWPVDERDGNEMPDVNTVVNAFHYHSLKLMARVSQALGYVTDEQFYIQRAEKVKESINKLFFDQQKRCYVDGEGSAHASLHANIFPLAFGLVPDAFVADVAALIRSKGMACSVYASQYLLESLYEAGEDKAALELMRSTGDRSWWNMIQSGSTITLEAWDIKFKPNLDWNHAWGAVPANMITRGFWGIVPLTPGFGKAQVKPQTGGVLSSKIKVPTIRGEINGAFDTDNRTRFDLQLTLPSNMKGVVFIPVRDIANPVLWIEGKRIEGKRDGKFFVAETGGGETRFLVKSGR